MQTSCATKLASGVCVSHVAAEASAAQKATISVSDHRCYRLFGRRLTVPWVPGWLRCVRRCARRARVARPHWQTSRISVRRLG